MQGNKRVSLILVVSEEGSVTPVFEGEVLATWGNSLQVEDDAQIKNAIELLLADAMQNAGGIFESRSK